jgi:hypothetical protein
VTTPGGSASVDTLTVQAGSGTVPGFAINAAGTVQALTTVYARNADGNSNALIQVLGNGNGAGNATAVQIGSYVRATGTTRTDIRIDAINNSDTKNIAYFDATNVRMGVNQNAPKCSLDVNGAIASSNGFFVQSPANGIYNGSPVYGLGFSSTVVNGAAAAAVQLSGFYGLTFATANAYPNVISIDTSGRVGINTVSQSYTFDIKGGTTATDCLRVQGSNTGTGGGRIVFQNAETNKAFVMYGPNNSEQFYIYASTTGSFIYQTTTMSSTWTVGSDRRLKNVIGPVVNSTSQLENLNPVHYTMKADPSARQVTGLIAQEVLPYYPNLVSEHTPPNTTDIMYGLDYGGFITPLIAAVKELSARLSNVEAQLAART